MKIPHQILRSLRSLRMTLLTNHVAEATLPAAGGSTCSRIHPFIQHNCAAIKAGEEGVMGRALLGVLGENPLGRPEGGWVGRTHPILGTQREGCRGFSPAGGSGVSPGDVSRAGGWVRLVPSLAPEEEGPGCTLVQGGPCQGCRGQRPGRRPPRPTTAAPGVQGTESPAGGLGVSPSLLIPLLPLAGEGGPRGMRVMRGSLEGDAKPPRTKRGMRVMRGSLEGDGASPSTRGGIKALSPRVYNPARAKSEGGAP